MTECKPTVTAADRRDDTTVRQVLRLVGAGAGREQKAKGCA
jgi:hypothetical protein